MSKPHSSFATAILAASLILTGCGAATVSTEGQPDGRYRLTYDFGAIDSHPNMRRTLEGQAQAVCPSGWRIIRQEVVHTPGLMDDTRVWDIECVSSD